MLPSEARVAVRLAIKSTSAEIVSAIEADRAVFIRVCSCMMTKPHCFVKHQRDHDHTS